jgi:hypothetical protein
LPWVGNSATTKGSNSSFSDEKRGNTKVFQHFFQKIVINAPSTGKKKGVKK